MLAWIKRPRSRERGFFASRFASEMSRCAIGLFGSTCGIVRAAGGFWGDTARKSAEVLNENSGNENVLQADRSLLSADIEQLRCDLLCWLLPRVELCDDFCGG